MLGFLLARHGVNVAVLEKHDDFFRDFRGDTIHPSTMEVMHELDILDAFLEQPHQKAAQLNVMINGNAVPGINFSSLPTQAKYIAMMPQWDFLNFIASQAAVYSNFNCHMATEATDLIEENGIVKGVIATTKQGEIQVNADLVVAADGRASTLRNCSKLKVVDSGAPIDVLWFRLEKPERTIHEAMARIKDGNFMITIDRGNYYQSALIIKKGHFETIKAKGLASFRQRISRVEPNFANVVTSIKSWEQVKLLSVQVNHLEQWHQPGLLCIGDAAHAMSPMGGVGVNLAIQDAVATANLLAEKLIAGNCHEQDLARVQSRRMWPAKMTQRLQIIAQQRLFGNAQLDQPLTVSTPLALFLTLFGPLLRKIMARIIGIGFRAEHINTDIK